MKVVGIREVEIEIHRGVKRFSDVRYVPKFKRNLISLGRLESKGCTFKASGGTLKVIRRSLVIIKDLRSKRNLYELQVGSGSLGHKGDNGVVCRSKRIIFDDGKNIGFTGEIVSATDNILNNEVTLEHIFEHTLLALCRRVIKMCDIAMV